MTVVDFDALQATQGPRVTLLPSTFVGPLVTGVDYSDFSTLSSVYVTAKVQLIGAHGPPTLTVTIDDSNDGNSWSTVETFTFTTDGTQSVLLSSPKAHLRAKAVGAQSEWQVVYVSAAPTYLDPAGGGSISVSDGSTTVDPATSLVFTGATVSDGGGGEADIAVSGGSQAVKIVTASFVLADFTYSGGSFLTSPVAYTLAPTEHFLFGLLRVTAAFDDTGSPVWNLMDSTGTFFLTQTVGSTGIPSALPSPTAGLVGLVDPAAAQGGYIPQQPLMDDSAPVDLVVIGNGANNDGVAGAITAWIYVGAP